MSRAAAPTWQQKHAPTPSCAAHERRCATSSRSSGWQTRSNSTPKSRVTYSSSVRTISCRHSPYAMRRRSRLVTSADPPSFPHLGRPRHSRAARQERASCSGATARLVVGAHLAARHDLRKGGVRRARSVVEQRAASTTDARAAATSAASSAATAGATASAAAASIGHLHRLRQSAASSTSAIAATFTAASTGAAAAAARGRRVRARDPSAARAPQRAPRLPTATAPPSSERRGSARRLRRRRLRLHSRN